MIILTSSCSQSNRRKTFGEDRTLWRSPPRFSQIESVPHHKVKEEKSERRGTWVSGAGGPSEGRAGLKRIQKATAYLHGNECPGTNSAWPSPPLAPPHSHSLRTVASPPISHLSDEGVSDFPVIPFSRPEAFTHCSLLRIIALAWAVVHGHRVDGGHRLWIASRVTVARLWVGRVGRVATRQDRRLPVAPLGRRARVQRVAVLIRRGGTGAGHGRSRAEGT